ncbi:FAD-dependent oxidoreductase [Nonomuraea sp. NPDC049504]|uniref:FAD-dependent oxidoreductase n=1 Tax=Nonomuraea sp. NPDC049504 TaxID=3154729 RepID=UPI003419F9A3
MSERNVPVLIVGGGITGLTTALFLSWHGVRCTLVERHPDLLTHPRARGLTPRTMELYRQAGLEQAIRDAAYVGGGFTWTPVVADTLAGEHASPEEPDEDDGSGSSPCGFGPIDQDRLEVIVRDQARKLGADLRFGTELVAFEQDGEGVTATLLDRTSGVRESVRAGYLVAADGFHSPVRHRLGIEVDGPGPMFTTLTAIVEADLNPALRGRTLSIAYLQRPRPYTMLMAHDTEGRRWVFGTGLDGAAEDYDDERVAAMVREAAGLPDAEVRLHPQIPGTDLTVLAFPIGAHLARSYRRGRVFLAGDAAHVWPPTGGLGANAGIQDAHNLAWKLAWVITGRAGAGLLDTYQAERRPVGELTMGQALARFGARMGPGRGPQVIDYGAVSMGYRYPVDGERPGEPVQPRLLDGTPGTRAPHVPLAGGRSTLDLYGSAFVLLTPSPAWRSPDADVQVVEEEVARAHGIGPEGAALVRPDGFVAWRSDAHDEEELARALDEVLHRL